MAQSFKVWQIYEGENGEQHRLVVWEEDAAGVRSIAAAYGSWSLDDLKQTVKELHPDVPFYKDVKRKYRVTKKIVQELTIEVEAYDEDNADELACVPENDDKWSFDEHEEIYAEVVR